VIKTPNDFQSRKKAFVGEKMHNQCNFGKKFHSQWNQLACTKTSKSFPIGGEEVGI
jgi:hypothetical protein